MSDAEQCETCRFVHREYGHQRSALQCRRHAPAPDVKRAEFLGCASVWPLVLSDWRCGDWEPRVLDSP